MTPKDKLASGRLMACQRVPYFRSAIMNLIPKPLDGYGTFGTTDKGVMFWDPKLAEVWSVESIASVIVHEVSHLLRGHGPRCERIRSNPNLLNHRQLWNQAADEEINDDLEAAGLHLPTEPFEPVHPKKYGHKEGLTAEEYYALLLKDAKSISISSSGGQKGDGQKGGSGKDGKKAVGAGGCGGCAGNPNDNEPQDSGSLGRSEVEINRIKRTVAEAIRKESSSGRGTVPASWQRWADEQLVPAQIPWQQKLSRIIRGAIAYRSGAVDLHWNKPSRRQAGVGFGVGKPSLPAFRAPLPKVAVVVDTSGSMGDKELTAALTETRGVLSAVGAAVEFVACDAEVHEIKKVSTWRGLVDLLKGGGGTDMQPAFEALKKRHNRPDVTIVFTDGWIGDAGPQPPFKVIWVVTGEKNNHTPAPWGDIVIIPTDHVAVSKKG